MALPSNSVKQIKVLYRGSEIKYRSALPPVLKNDDYSYAPIRDTLKGIKPIYSDNNIKYDNNTKIATYKSDDGSQVFTSKTISKSQIDFTYQGNKIDLHAFIFNDTIYIRLRDLFVVLGGYEIGWEKEKATVVIVKKVVKKDSIIITEVKPAPIVLGTLPPNSAKTIKILYCGSYIKYREDKNNYTNYFPPVLKTDNYSYVPIRDTLNYLNPPYPNSNITYDENTKTATYIDINRGGKFVSKTINENQVNFTYNNTSVNLHAFVFSGTIYVRIRDLIDTLAGYDISWDGPNATVIITKKVAMKVKPLTDDGIEKGGSKKVQENFQDQINDYTANVWDSTAGANVNRNKYDPYFYGPKLGEKPDLIKKGFDINIVYGGALQTLIELNKYNAAKNAGNPEASKAFEQYVYNSVKAIKGVYIRSIGQVFDASGKVIGENYEFIAKDLE